MPLDINAVWQYEESDVIETFSRFMNLGQKSVSAALGKIGASLGTTAQRDAAYPEPPAAADRVALQNLMVTYHNTDLGYDERYYASETDAYSNPRGVSYAGWYPIAGIMPLGILRRTTAQLIGSGADYEKISTDTAWNAVTLDGGISQSDGFTVPLHGNYRVSFSLAAGQGLPYAAGFLRNATAVSSGGTLDGMASYSDGGPVAFASGSAVMPLSVGDNVALWAYGNAEYGAESGPSISIEYVSPLRGLFT